LSDPGAVESRPMDLVVRPIELDLVRLEAHIVGDLSDRP
jgi:hypothetical protein